MTAWPGTELVGLTSPILSVIGLVFGLGFVLSFGYWTTNFVEVQRAMASKSMNNARRTPIIGSFPKMFVPFIVIIPGMLAAVLVPEVRQGKASGNFDFNNSLLYLMRDLLPNGMLGVAIAGLLASFMAGMAANISSFNTVFSYDIWQDYVVKDREDGYYLRVGRVITVVAVVAAMGTALIASQYTNLMDYLQLLFSFFNAPLFATFILGMFWKKMTPTAGWVGLVSGTLTAIVIAVLSEDAFGTYSTGVLPLSGQGASFVAAGVAFAVDIVISAVVSMAGRPKPESQLVGLVYSLTPRENFHDPRDDNDAWYQKPGLLAGISLAMVLVLNLIFG
jgi:solute:Na+ symporter, SSS family